MTTTGYSDTFGRTVSNGLGTATSGQAYTINGTASQYSVAPNTASILPTAIGERYGYVELGSSDVDITGQVALSAIPASNLTTVGFVAKMTTFPDYYVGSMMVATGGAMSVRFSRVISGSLVTISTTATGVTYVANTFYNLRFAARWSQALQTNVLQLRIWAVGATEPTGWTAVALDANLTQYTSGTRVGIHTRNEATVSGLVTAKIQNVAVTSYNLPIPATTDTMCAAPGVSSTSWCTAALVSGSFETGDPAGSGWFVQNGTLDGDHALPFSGAWCALATATGGQLNMRSYIAFPATVGVSYRAPMWVRCSVATSVVASIDYYDGGGGYLGSSSSSTPVLANTWTLIVATGTAPASTASLQYGPTLTGPAVGTVLRADEIDIQTSCTVVTPPYPAQTALESLADAADVVADSFDPLAALAASYPRVRVSNTLLSINTAAISIPVTFSATEFNVGTPTNLAYDSVGIYLGVGIWHLLFEMQLSEATSDYILVSIGDSGPGVSPSVDMRSNAVQTNDAGVGGCVHVSKTVIVTDPATPLRCSAVLGPNNVATTYTATYVALSAIKISDYFA
jgi:hypothetical protein